MAQPSPRVLDAPANDNSAINSVRARQLIGDALGGTLAPRQSMVTNPMTYGTFGSAVGCSTIVNSTHAPEVLGLRLPSHVSLYPDRDSVGCYVDNTAPPILITVAGTFTATSFVPGTPLDAAARSKLRVGMLIDTGHVTKYTGTLTGWAPDGSSLTVADGWFLMSSTSTPSFASTPPPGTVVINPVTKIWAHNANVYLRPDGQADKAAGFELGLFNNKREYDGASDLPRVWGYDVVSLGTFKASGPGFFARGNMARAFAYAAGGDGSDIRWMVAGPDGTMILGSAIVGTAPYAAFRTGTGQAYDARLGAVGGTAGQVGSALLFAQAAGLYIMNGDGSGNAVLIASAAAGAEPRISVIGADANQNLRVAASGTGRVIIESTVRLPKFSAAPASPAEGDAYYDLTLHKLRVWDGSAWQSAW